MANNLRAIRKRIGSIKSTQQIMKAMKMVAAAKLRRAQERAVGSRPYLDSLSGILKVMLSRGNIPRKGLFAQRNEVKNVAVLLYTSNRGLCGSFNNNLIRHAEEIIKKEKQEGREGFLYHVGKKGYQYFKKRNYRIEKFYEEIKENVTIEEMKGVCRDLVKAYLEEKIDKLIVVYSKFHTAASNKPLTFELLPIDIEPEADDPMVIYEPAHGELFDLLLPDLIRSRLVNAILESYASEQGSRMTAMEAASTNAGKMLKSMSLDYNKARQALITQELIEITGSSEIVKASA